MTSTLAAAARLERHPSNARERLASKRDSYTRGAPSYGELTLNPHQRTSSLQALLTNVSPRSSMQLALVSASRSSPQRPVRSPSWRPRPLVLSLSTPLVAQYVLPSRPASALGHTASSPPMFPPNRRSLGYVDSGSNRSSASTTTSSFSGGRLQSQSPDSSVYDSEGSDKRHSHVERLDSALELDDRLDPPSEDSKDGESRARDLMARNAVLLAIQQEAAERSGAEREMARFPTFPSFARDLSSPGTPNIELSKAEPSTRRTIASRRAHPSDVAKSLGALLRFDSGSVLPVALEPPTPPPSFPLPGLPGIHAEVDTVVPSQDQFSDATTPSGTATPTRPLALKPKKARTSFFSTGSTVFASKTASPPDDDDSPPRHPFANEDTRKKWRPGHLATSSIGGTATTPLWPPPDDTPTRTLTAGGPPLSSEHADRPLDAESADAHDDSRQPRDPRGLAERTDHSLEQFLIVGPAPGLAVSIAGSDTSRTSSGRAAFASILSRTRSVGSSPPSVSTLSFPSRKTDSPGSTHRSTLLETDDEEGEHILDFIDSCDTPPTPPPKHKSQRNQSTRRHDFKAPLLGLSTSSRESSSIFPSRVPRAA